MSAANTHTATTIWVRFSYSFSLDWLPLVAPCSPCLARLRLMDCLAVQLRDWLLCVNNLRDIESDGNHGKHTWMTAMGLRNGTIFTIAILIISALIALRHLLQSSIYAANSIPLIAIIAILCAAQSAASYAIARKTYRRALPLCSLDSLTVAAIFVLSTMLA